MAFFEWKSDYHVGHEKIDFQHHNLVNMINNIHDATTLEKDAAEVAVRVTLENLVDYTVFHFQTEEDLMKDFKFPDLAQHLKEHALLKARVLDFQKKFEEGKLEVSVLLEFLKDWLLNHIGKRDIELAQFIKRVS